LSSRKIAEREKIASNTCCSNAGRGVVHGVDKSQQPIGSIARPPPLPRNVLGDARNLVVLRGGMKAADRNAAEAALRVSDDQERLILATGRYLGEGFDDHRLDTLFLTMPISWKGTLAQYVGRLHREHQGKSDVLVYDYVDGAVQVLARMAAKRRTGYRTLGYRLD
jgi:hypothetical protein